MVSFQLLVEALSNTLNTMSSEKRFSQLLFYLESCESGSMFESTLPTDAKSDSCYFE